MQMPLNLFDAHYRSFAKLVVPELVKRCIGVLGMKSMANGILLKSKTVTPIECLHYALNLPTSVVITGIDSIRGQTLFSVTQENLGLTPNFPFPKIIPNHPRRRGESARCVSSGMRSRVME